MTTIKYEINGKVTEIEVEDSFASAYLEIETESKREQWRQDWHNRKHNCSLEAMEANGAQFAAPDTLEEDEEKEELRRAIAQLTPEQQEIIQRVYFNGEKKSEVAKSLGIANSSLTERLQRILKKLKSLLQ